MYIYMYIEVSRELAGGEAAEEDEAREVRGEALVHLFWSRSKHRMCTHVYTIQIQYNRI